MTHYVKLTAEVYVRTDWHELGLKKLLQEELEGFASCTLSETFPFNSVMPVRAERVPYHDLPIEVLNEVLQIEELDAELEQELDDLPDEPPTII